MWRYHFTPYYIWFLRYQLQQIFFVILGQNIKKMKKKKKKLLEISSFYTSLPKIMIIGYPAPEIWHITDVIIFHFGLFFCSFTPVTAQKMKILKK